jgi:hypothetical protein
MADQNASVFDMTDFTVTRRIAQNYIDDVKVHIDQGAASGGRITGTNFLAGIEPGQEQILIHSGNQSIHIDESQWVMIIKKRNTTVGQEELYVNVAMYDHQVWGPYFHKHHNTTKEEYVLDTNVDYYQHIRVTEHLGDMRIRNVKDVVIVNGSEFTTHNGKRTRLMWGFDTTLTAPLRLTGIGGIDLKAALFDSSFSLVKDSCSVIDGKATVYESKIGGVKSDIRLFNFLPFGFLIRVGAFCVKGVAAAVGSIRW